MPQATDLVIKNHAAVDKTFALLSPAAGDDSWANWRLKEGTISKVFPAVAALSRVTPNVARKLIVRLQIPSSYTDTVTGLTSVASKFDVEIKVTVPDDFPEALKDDAVAYTKNLVSHSLIQAMMRDALPAN